LQKINPLDIKLIFFYIMLKLVFLLLATAYASSWTQLSRSLRDILSFEAHDHEIDHEFAKFMVKYRKSYSSDDEYVQRREVFANNLAFIKDHNSNADARGLTFTVAVNHLTDRTHDEYRGILGLQTQNSNTVLDEFEPVVAPANWDWRIKKKVGPVKNQQSCGSCYSFSAVAALESLWAIKKGVLLTLSEQQIVDCSGSEGNQGCSGGLMNNVFQYVLDNKGICSQVDYPYEGRDNTCRASNCKNVMSITRYMNLPTKSDSAMVQALYRQVVSVAIEADRQSFQFYSNGVYNDVDCGTNLDHGVALVGYTNNSYILRNSWGASWGNAGYMQLARGRDANGGYCGVLMMPSVPVI
jgi:C1A family cysteine protease